MWPGSPTYDHPSTKNSLAYILTRWSPGVQDKVLEALKGKTYVAILVNKEDWLRPDTNEDVNDRPGFHARLRNLYGELAKAVKPIDALALKGLLYDRADSPSATVGPVECFGEASNAAPAATEEGGSLGKPRTSPTLHHKFLVFGNILQGYTEEGKEEDTSFRPAAVWTGSFNLSFNASNNLENALWIPSAELAREYTKEFSWIAVCREPLDWQAQYVYQSHRLGT